MILYAGGTRRALTDAQTLHGEIPYLFFVLLDENILIPHQIMQFLLVILGKLLLILHLILIHLLVLTSPVALLLQLCNQSIDASLGVICAVFAFILVDYVLILEHVSECGYF